jgi:sulfur relay (sulfurtransferase) DsrF/TusC family protein
MANYLFISSRDPYESSDSADLLDLVRNVKARNNSATLFLVQNGVVGARQGARHNDRYQRLAQAGVPVLADAFSLRERAVGKLADGIKVANIDRLVDLLVEPDIKAIWR